MDQHLLISILLFLGFFFGMIGFVQHFSNKTSFPYTVALLIVGFVGHFLVQALHLDLHLTLPPEIIYFVLLPILLFEAAMHINFHQFRLQFKTITFFSTFGLLLSMFVVGGVLAMFAGVPIGPALLFGALISATDPIAVLALFKVLGAPKRLSLLADGESMFNDATAVIAFKLVAAFVVTETAFGAEKLIHGFGDFLYVFFGSMFVGVLSGLIGANLISYVRENRLIVSILTAALAFGSFVGAEHFFHFSGVITCVMAGITLGNFGRTKMSRAVLHGVEQLWESLGFVALSLVFFFASFNLDFHAFFDHPERLVVVVGAVLAARAVSVYVSSWLSNVLPFFNDEPNIPMSWQHILNWGGLRGVIPLVLAYSLPDTFMYKEDLIAFTLISLLFTLIVNGLTIKSLLMKLGLHLPKKEEALIAEENVLFNIEEAKQKLKAVEVNEFSKEALRALSKKLNQQEEKVKQHLLDITDNETLQKSLELQSITIERETVHELFEKGHINERVYHQFDVELDLQQDALEYPEVFANRVIEDGGKIRAQLSYRAQMRRLRQNISNFPALRGFFKQSQKELIEERYALLRARVVSSGRVLEYLKQVAQHIPKKRDRQPLENVMKLHQKLIAENKRQLQELEADHRSLLCDYQERILKTIVMPATH